MIIQNRWKVMRCFHIDERRSLSKFFDDQKTINMCVCLCALEIL